MNIYALVFLNIGFSLILIAWTWTFKSSQCAEQRPEPKGASQPVELDIQFSDSNKPSVIYSDMFNSGNVWMGGYSLDSGRTIVSTPKTYTVQKK
ncbi:MAG: hypothetical protein EBU90_10740 [Proteobacteria bacterium]|nr:hypothetical protein [Pseudomonadota bacterium]NBP14666.1 hypothetical protein [bacterium]